MRVANILALWSAVWVSTEWRLVDSSATGRNNALDKRFELNQARANAVKEMFKTSWDGYYTYAFPMDALKPASASAWNPRNGWAASAVDALDTAIIMELDDITHSILDHIPKIDYTNAFENSWVSLFETTIRYLGGMLSAYDLLDGPYSHMVRDKSEKTALLDQSIKLAETLSFAFDTPTGIPFNLLLLSEKINARHDFDDYYETGLAVAGSLILEWKHLSDLTGNARYGQLAEKAETYLLDPKPASHEPFPGMTYGKLNYTNGQFYGNAVGGWDGSNDSFYEYLIKAWIYNPELYGRYKDRWITAAESTIKYLMVSPDPRPDITFVSIFNGSTLNQDMGHLSCFIGGNFILGGLVLQEQRYIDNGVKLTQACMHTYASTATKIGPEFWSWNATDVPEEQAKFFKKNGFWIKSAEYILRPEYIESLYYAYRVTGNVSYQEAAWDALVHINYTTRIGSGYSSITDVNSPDGGETEDNQESFIFAELLKYGYLIFAEDAAIQVNKKDEKEKWVFNTEAHPLKIKSELPVDKTHTREQRVFNGSPLQP